MPVKSAGSEPDLTRDISNRAIVLLAAIGALGSIAIHMAVPAMPDIAADLGAEPTAVQLAISLYLVGMSAGQLIGGFVSDHVGRRPVILSAIALFVAGSVGAAFAQNITTLIAFRIVQAAGGGAGVIVARTIVSDLSTGEAVAGRIAFMTTIVLVSPALSPVIGGILAGAGGWRSVFVLLAICGALAALVTAGLVRESLMKRGNGGGGLGERYVAILKHLNFWRLTAVIACSSSIMYAFLSGSSFLFIDRYGLTPAQAGFCYLSIAGAGIVGTFAVRGMEKRGGALRAGTSASLIGALMLLAAGAAGFNGAFTLTAPMLVIGFGAGLTAPSGFAAVLRTVKGMSGATSSLAGAIQMLASGLTTSLIAQRHAEDLVTIAIPMVCLGSISLLLAPLGRVADHEAV